MKKCLDGRKVRNNKLFKVAHRRMTAAGYHRSVDQLKFRWKLLKSAYYKCKREPNSPAPTKIQGWWRYEKTMIAIMESRHPLVGAGVNSDRNDEVTEDSDGEASMLHWPQPCPDNSTQNLGLIVGVMPCRVCDVVLSLDHNHDSITSSSCLGRWFPNLFMSSSLKLTQI